MRRTSSNCPPLYDTYYYYYFYEAKLCLRKLILLLFFRQITPLLDSGQRGQLEICRLLVESKADVAARTRCFSPPPSHHLSLTICLQSWQNCTQMRHRLAQRRRCCIPAQHRRAGMTRCPVYPRCPLPAARECLPK
jgi:hypothetical protein